MTPTIKDLIAIGGKTLEDSGVENPVFDAETLLSFETGFDKQQLFMNWGKEAEDLLRGRYFDLINRRANGEPLQYITGEQYFMGYRFSVDPSVLIPRPETELLAEKAIAYIKSHENVKSILDLCTGSGALAICISKAIPGAKIMASDISDHALNTAKKNACELGADSQIDFIKSDVFEGIRSEEIDRKFDLIVTNPPYIRSKDIANLQREIYEHEPVLALDGGVDGLDFYRRIASESDVFLNENACIMTEIGFDQAADISAIFISKGFKNPEISQDISGFDRIIKVLK